MSIEIYLPRGQPKYCVPKGQSKFIFRGQPKYCVPKGQSKLSSQRSTEILCSKRSIKLYLHRGQPKYCVQGQSEIATDRSRKINQNS